MQGGYFVVEVFLPSRIYCGKYILLSLLELNFDQWHVKHLMLISFDNHKFLFTQCFSNTLQSTMNISPKYIFLR